MLMEALVNEKTHCFISYPEGAGVEQLVVNLASYLLVTYALCLVSVQ